ncbi:LacI family DNA-binding transcriptional regulator [Frigoribacterium sp. CFBP 8754]|uniref:LacI family DNA-binding transcriptional regulator n=1 Tax=Frigoribacterium sp. CFBP 8754 TaxID=2775290 RepID=UPI00178144F9|nr:LacI family DNA-binding transcriptional regulator [Frigoribacterium sp. CFBP 8754]MBD8660758.1 LacI family DNA-binding transcriptional regulator [Frigoribacterium sp. CFBP 8754]
MPEATIYDVAKRAGVSHQTVSRFLRGFEGIRPATREKVESALAELDYRPNSAARFLRLGRSNRIALLADNMHQSGPALTIAGATEAARSLGYVTDIVSMDGTDVDSVRDALDLVLSQQISGIVLTAQTAVAREAIAERNMTVPVARDFGLLLRDSDQTVNEDVGRLAGEHLLTLGHRDVAYVAGPLQWLPARERLDGFRKAFIGGGGRIARVVEGDWSADSGFSAGLTLVADHALGGGSGGITAIALANDPMAMGLMAALSSHGVSVPADVSVVGVDNAPEARFMVPPLTSIDMDFRSEGAHVVTALIAVIEGKAEDRPVRLPAPRLIVRTSTAAPRS